MPQSTENFTDLLSNDIQEIIGKPPKYLIRWGTTILVVLLLIFSILCKMITYPDIVETNIILVSSNYKESHNKYYGEICINHDSLKKLKVGHKIIIKFNDYPSKDFGVIIAKVNSLTSNITRDNCSGTYVEFVNGFTTTYHKAIVPKVGMTAKAEIITENKSVSDRLFPRAN